MKILIALCTTLIMLGGCSHHKKEKKQVQTAAATQTVEIKTAETTTLKFSPGQKQLSSMNKQRLDDLNRMVLRDAKKINEIKVLAWSDKEYIDKPASASAIQLAEARVKNITKYLEQNLRTTAFVNEYNMAKQPTMWDSLVRNEEYAVKESFEGRTPSSTSKASKAIVIIEYEVQK